MKFKSSHRINQRIERISTHHLIIGIDIAKETHVAAAVNFRGIQQGRILSFQNDAYGLKKLLKWVADLQKAGAFQEVIFGAESTGHYFLNLAFALREQGRTVVLVNPMTTKRNKENRDNKPSKNDAKDALTIADVISRGYYNDWVVNDTIYRKLKTLVDEKEALSTDLAALGNQIQTAVDQVFPEFTTLFKEWNGVRARATLSSFPLPSDILQLTASEIIEGWRRAGMKRAGGRQGARYAAALRDIAARSIGLTDIAQEMKRRISRLLDRREDLCSQLFVLEQEIDALLSQVPPEVLWPLQQLGMNPWFTAVILGNTGDLRRYNHGQQVLALAGLNLSESASGKRKGQIIISKRGRRQLRKYLYLAVLMQVCNHPSFKRWHVDNVETRKRKGRHSIFKLIGKFCRILVALAHSGETFDESKHERFPLAA
jgi:transposase